MSPRAEGSRGRKPLQTVSLSEMCVCVENEGRECEGFLISGNGIMAGFISLNSSALSCWFFFLGGHAVAQGQSPCFACMKSKI